MSDDERKLKPADKNPWFLLATAAGVPKSELEDELIAQNARLWNMAMMTIFPEATASLINDMGGDPDGYLISPNDRNRINSRLADLDRNLDSLKKFERSIHLSETEFVEGLYWRGYIIPVALDFRLAKIIKNVSFQWANFGSQVNFCGVIFHGEANFSHIEGRDMFIFNDSVFYKSANFENSIFEGYLSFAGVDFKYNSDFQSAKFRAPFSFEQVHFASAPLFFGTEFHEGMDWQGVTWPPLPPDEVTARNEIPRYERLAQEMDRLQRHEDQHFFFRKAMLARRVRDGRWSLPGILNGAYEIVAGHGFDVVRAFKAWATIIAVGWLSIFALAFRGAADSQAVPKIWQNGWRESFHCGQVLNDAGTALAVSFANAHAILGLNRVFMKSTYGLFDTTSPHYAGASETAIFWFNLIGGVQTIVGAIMLFFVVLTLRNRFRMR